MANPFKYDYSSENGFFHFGGSSRVIYFKYNFVNKGLPAQYSRLYQQVVKNQQVASKVPAEEKPEAVEKTA